MGSGDWTFSNLVQYYDANTDIVAESAGRLSALDAVGQDQALARIAAMVRAHAEQLRSAGQDMAQAAVSVTDDLYKTLARARRWSPEATGYVRAVFGTFLSAVSRWGYQIRYIVENTFPDFLDRPLIFYPGVYRQVGFSYVCPHELAWRIAEHDNLLAAGQAPTMDKLAAATAEGRHLAAAAAQRAAADGRHLAYFEIDWQPGSLDPIDALPAPAGTIQIFRSAAPAPGTTVKVRVVGQ